MIQVTLTANRFEWAGTYNGRTYTSLKVDYTSNGRVYFTTIKDGIQWSTMAKQMKLDNGKVYVSFGKQGNLIIGTYVDDSVIIEEVSEPIQEEVNNEIVNDDQSYEITQQNVNTEENHNNKIIKEKGLTDIPVFMRDYTEKAEYNYIIKHKGFEGYIIKRSKSWWIVSHSKWVVMGSDTKKEAIDKFIKFVDDRYNVLKENGYLSA